MINKSILITFFILITSLAQSQEVKNIHIEMVFVKGGTFQMGSDSGWDYEKPIHTVHLNDFYIGKYEITAAQFKQFIDETAYTTDAEKQGKVYCWTNKNPDNKWQWTIVDGVFWQYDIHGVWLKNYTHPVIHVSWNDAMAYCKWLSQKTNNNYRLPTEAEWEYAARGGVSEVSTTYSGSNTIDDVAWYSDNSGHKTHPVGQKQPNELGIYDMSGNVWEWCYDWFSDTFYSSGMQNNPQGPSSGTFRVLRGGSWKGNTTSCKVSYRYSSKPDGFTRYLNKSKKSYTYLNYGFRIVKDIN